MFRTPRPAPVPPPRPPTRPTWANLSNEEKGQLLRLLHRMLTDRLAAVRPNAEGTHDHRA